jgi:Skp family chaperone for outer membrane proteins
MKTASHTAALLALLLAAALGVQGQDHPAGSNSVGVLNLRDALDKTRNVWTADIELEIAKMTEAESGRANDLNPQERARIRAKIQDAGNRKKLEVYNEVVRLSGVVAKERGFALIQRIDRMPALEGGETDLSAQIDRRGIVYFNQTIDITTVVLERLNRDYAARKK